MNRMQIDSIYLRARERQARIEATEALHHFCEVVNHHAADRTQMATAHIGALMARLRASVRHGGRRRAETGALVDQLRDVPLDDERSTLVAGYQALRLLDAVTGYTAIDAAVA